MKLLGIILLFLAPSLVFSQQKVSWDALKEVTFTEKFNEELGSYLNVPTFGEKLKLLAGKEIEITGYVIPLDVKQSIYVLSANPFAACFFCGGAGPESVIDIKFLKAPRRYKTDERITVRGKLKLNATDIYQLTFVLEGTKQVN